MFFTKAGPSKLFGYWILLPIALVIVEIKAIEEITEIEKLQVINYLKADVVWK